MSIKKLKPAAVAHKVVDGTSVAIDDFNNKVIDHETAMTDRLFGSIAQALDGRSIGNLKWKAKTLKSGRGVAAEETRHGADLLGVLEIALPDYQTKKGFLLQAKLAEPSKPISSSEWRRFQDQCKVMLERTHEAFGVIYSREAGTVFIPAATILEIDRHQLFDVGSRSLFGFFKGHVKCEIGDRKLNAPTIDVLERTVQTPQYKLTADYPAKTLFAAKVTND